jgi:hypothetical protein
VLQGLVCFIDKGSFLGYLTTPGHRRFYIQRQIGGEGKLLCKSFQKYAPIYLMISKPFKTIHS